MPDQSPPNEAPDDAVADATAQAPDGAVAHATDGATGEVPNTATDAEPNAGGTDLDRVAADLDGVEAALARLDDGTYWTDEVTGEPIDEAVLRADPVARRNPAGA